MTAIAAPPPAPRGAWVPYGLATPVLLALVVLAIIPCAQLLVQALEPSNEAAAWPDLTNFVALFESKVGQQAAWRTVRVSVIVTLITIVAGYPLALFIARARPAWRPVLIAIVVFPFLISAVVRAFGWTVLLGRSGLVNKMLVGSGIISEPLTLVQNETGIVIGETHLLLPYMVLSLLAVLQRIDPHLEDAAKSLGASPVGVFWRVIVPMTLPGLLTGTLLVFSLAMTAFATPFLLGGGRTPLLTTLLYQYAFTLYDWKLAATIGVVLLCFGAAYVTLHRFISGHGMRGYG